MRTPKEYLTNLRNGVITENMLSDVIYSYSKRAKNFRDRIRERKEHSREYRNFNSRIIDDYANKKEDYYGKKSDILKKCANKVTAIHKLTFECRKRVYDYEEEWMSLKDERAKYNEYLPSKVVWVNNFFDKVNEEYVEFCDIIQDKSRHFLYYEIGKHSFHRPIVESELSEYDGIEIVELQELRTNCEDVTNLLSVQFCNKVWKYITHPN